MENLRNQQPRKKTGRPEEKNWRPEDGPAGLDNGLRTRILYVSFAFPLCLVSCLYQRPVKNWPGPETSTLPPWKKTGRPEEKKLARILVAEARDPSFFPDPLLYHLKRFFVDVYKRMQRLQKNALGVL